MRNKNIVSAINADESGGFLIRGELSHAEAIKVVFESDESDGGPVFADHLKTLEYCPGWYRKNPCSNGDYAWMLGDGSPGQPGSFQAVYLRRKP